MRGPPRRLLAAHASAAKQRRTPRRLHTGASAAALGALRDGPLRRLGADCTAWWAGLPDERKWRREAGEALLRARLLHPPELDAHLSQARRRAPAPARASGLQALAAALCGPHRWHRLPGEACSAAVVVGYPPDQLSSARRGSHHWLIGQVAGAAACTSTEAPYWAMLWVAVRQVLGSGQLGHLAVDFAVHLVRACVLAEPVLGAPDLPATLETLGKVAYSLPAPAGLQLQALVLEARRAKCVPPPARATRSARHARACPRLELLEQNLIGLPERSSM